MMPTQIVEFDKNDLLATKRNEFFIPDNTIYMDGNSLGPLPFRARQRLSQVISNQWGEDLIHSWNKHHWIDLPVSAGEKIAPLVGAAPGQVICCDSISVNLFKLLAGALALNSSRSVILSQEDNFPTDLYTAQGLSGLLGEKQCRLKLVGENELIDQLDDSIAVLMLTHVNFRCGRMHDMHRITALAHQHGVIVIWDLAHSAGALPVDLDAANVDFAVGCGYKYLNGGPGAPAFLYVAKRHQTNISQPISGWMGHRAPFDFDSAYHAASGVNRFLSGTPNILSMTALDAALDVFAEVNMQHIRSKSVALSELFSRFVSESDQLHQFR